MSTQNKNRKVVILVGPWTGCIGKLLNDTKMKKGQMAKIRIAAKNSLPFEVEVQFGQYRIFYE